MVEKSKTDNRRKEFKLIVRSSMRISESIQRVILFDESLTLSEKNEGAYLRLLFPTNDEIVKRSYTIREIDQSNHLITIDFVRHNTASIESITNGTEQANASGPAACWATRAEVGDMINAIGPGPVKPIDEDKDWCLIIGDMTSLPAIAVNLKNLNSSFKGHVIVEVSDESDRQTFTKPNGLSVDWIINSNPNNSINLLLQKLEDFNWMQGNPYIWVANEFSSASGIRRFLNESFTGDNKINKKDRYISSYWKLGDSDEGNKRAKALDGNF